jgi:hypothetical protein
MPRPGLLARLSELRRPQAEKVPDWETITGSQYTTRSHVDRSSGPSQKAPGASENGGSPAWSSSSLAED